MPLRTAYAAILVAVVLAFASNAAAQSDVELLSNRNFDTDLSEWSFFPSGGASTMTWVAMDVDGSTSSGSARVEIDPVDIGNSGRSFQCVNVRGGASYDFGAWLFFPSSTSEEETFVRVQWEDERDCSGNAISSSDILTPPTRDAWVRTERSDVIAPTEARSAGLSLSVFEDSTLATNRIVFWDAATFVPEPRRAVQLYAVLFVLGLLVGPLKQESNRPVLKRQRGVGSNPDQVTGIDSRPLARELT